MDVTPTLKRPRERGGNPNFWVSWRATIAHGQSEPLPPVACRQGVETADYFRLAAVYSVCGSGQYASSMPSPRLRRGTNRARNSRHHRIIPAGRQIRSLRRFA